MTHNTLFTNQCQKLITDSQTQLSVFAFSFHLLPILSSLRRLPFPACFKILLFFLPSFFQYASSSHRLSCLLLFDFLNFFSSFLTLLFVSLGFGHLVLLLNFIKCAQREVALQVSFPNTTSISPFASLTIADIVSMATTPGTTNFTVAVAVMVVQPPVATRTLRWLPV